MTNDKKTIILTFVRHGQTDANIKRIVDGQGINSPLSDTGLQQAKSVGKALKDVTFNMAYSSDLKRANKTCELILHYNQAKSIGIESIKKEELLREKHFGVFEGQSWVAEKGKITDDCTPENGESEEDVQNRGRAFLKLMLKEVATMEHPVEIIPNVLIVSHGLFIRNLFSVLFDELNCSLPPNADFSSCANTCYSTFKVEICAEKCDVITMECQDLFNSDHLASLEEK